VLLVNVLFKILIHNTIKAMFLNADV